MDSNLTSPTPVQFLDGIRVVDFSQFLPGPYATQILSDLGASVVKIERPGGEAMRKVGPLDDNGISLFYKTLNSGKQVVELDLKSDQGYQCFSELLANTDVLLESFRPGVVDKLGFGIQYLRKTYPALVICSLSGYGQTGPYKYRAGHDLNYLAHSGLLHLTGTKDTPIQPQPPISDFAGAMQAVNSILAALVGRTKRNLGAHLDISVAESVLSWQCMALNNLGRKGYSMDRGDGMESGGVACYRIYRTADERFITLGGEDERFWANFCHTVEKPEWILRIHDPVPQLDLIAEVQNMFNSQPLVHWKMLLDDIDCCFETVLTTSEIVQHPQVVARQLVSQGEEPDSFIQVAYPSWVNGAPPTSRPPPRYVSINDVLEEWNQE
jgi:crotonobetainyl-CoA:carnitine CoA-transferase CaiB-like acyl-CoA transferase